MLYTHLLLSLTPLFITEESQTTKQALTLINTLETRLCDTDYLKKEGLQEIEKQKEFIEWYIKPTCELTRSAVNETKIDPTNKEALNAFIINRFWESCKARMAVIQTNISSDDYLRSGRSYTQDIHTNEFKRVFKEQCLYISYTDIARRKELIERYSNLFSLLQTYGSLTTIFKETADEQRSSSN